MTKTLITLLNENVGKTPDQIVKQLNNNGWVQGKHLPAEVWAQWKQSRITLHICHRGKYEPYPWSHDGGGYDPSWDHSHIFSGSLKNYWFIPHADYVSGVYPNAEPDPDTE